jgi:integrase
VSSDAWIFQRPAQVAKHGEAGASWYVGWYEPNGRRMAESFGPGPRNKKKAEARKRHIEAELMTGTYQLKTRTTWEEFRHQYRETVLAGKAVRTRDEAETCLDHFERVVKPKNMLGITTEHVDRYVAARRQEPGKKKGECVSPATINKELRHVKAALAKAKKWKMLRELPDFDFERQVQKLPTYMTPEHFAAVYAACGQAKLPRDLQGATAADWWRGVLVTGYMTGWRIGDMLALRRDDLDLDAGTAVTRGEDNKGKRDERVELHPAVVGHLKRLAGFGPLVFPWDYHRRTLDTEWHRIQEAAGVHLPCHAKHEHTDACHVYGFHDLRRAFATQNAQALGGDVLQAMMRHKSYETTKVYINLAPQMTGAAAKLHVPEVLRQRG